MFGAREGVTTNAHAERLAQPHVGRLCDGLVGQGARAGHNADIAGLVDVAWLDAHLAPERVDDTGAVRTNKTRLGLAPQSIINLVW